MSLKIKTNENYKNLKKNYLFSQIGKKVAEYKANNPDKKVISLGIGDVTLPLSETVVKALKSASDEMGKAETFKGYPDDNGYAFLREAVSDYYKRNSKISIDSSEIFISDGAKSDSGNIVEIFGDNPILIPDPVYPVYLDSNMMSGRKIEFLKGTMENGFKPSPEGIEKKSYIIYLCSPNNPTGAVYNKDELKAWVDFANETGSLIIFDAAYEAFIKGDFPHSIYEIEGARCCAVEICSFSKMAGFTGVRCAWSVFPDELYAGDIKLSSLWARRQATKFNGVSYIIQKAAQAALSPEGIEECKKNVDYYIENARILSQLLKDKGIKFTGGECSPYLWLECPGKKDSWEFFDKLLNSAQIVGTPGAGFGNAGEGYFRLTSFGSRENTIEAVKRLKNIF